MKSKLIHDRYILKEQNLLKLFIDNLNEKLSPMKNSFTHEIHGTSLCLTGIVFTQFAIEKINELCKQYSLTFVISCSGNKLFICITKNVLL